MLHEILEVLSQVILSPHLTFVLIALSLYRWTEKLALSFRWCLIGGILARAIFCIVYALVILNPSLEAEQLRLYVRFGLNLLFIDEIINSGGLGIRNLFKVKKTMKSINRKFNE